MATRVAVNGFGRIGKLVVRALADADDVELVAINDIADPEHLLYSFLHDSTHGKFFGAAALDHRGQMLVNRHTNICMLRTAQPELLPWKELNVDCVLECTGRFATRAALTPHLAAGAKRVLLSAPAKDKDIPTFVYGVNHANYNSATDIIVSNASCTTNCLAPLVKVLDDAYGVEEASMLTVHAVTASQPVVDGVASKKDWRGGRGALQSIIPSSTGAAQAIGLVLPHLAGKIRGYAVRVPVPDVSWLDLDVHLRTPTTLDALYATVEREAQRDVEFGGMRGILWRVDEPLVSSDLTGDSRSCIVDKLAGIAFGDGPTRHFKLGAWYDNEWAYACRMVDLVRFMAARDASHMPAPAAH